MKLRWKSIFQIMSSLRLQNFLKLLLAHSYLYSINYITSTFLLYLCNLTSINLDNRAWHEFSPLVPNMSHTNFNTKNSASFRISIDRFCWHDIKISINFFFKWLKRVIIINKSFVLLTNNLSIIKNFGLIVVLLAQLLQMLNCKWLTFFSTCWSWDMCIEAKGSHHWWIEAM